MDLPFVESFEPASLEAMSDWRAGDAWLAGGTALFSEPAPDLRRLLDLRALDWPALTVTRDGLEIAATCTIEELHSFQALPKWHAAPLFKQCPEALLASWKVWQEATVGGNICLALPAGAMTSLTAALDGVATILTPPVGEPRRIPVTKLVTGDGETSLAPGELLRSITIPSQALSAATAFRQVSLSPRGRSAALVIGRRESTGTTVITITASVPRPYQLRFPGLPSAAKLTDALTQAAPIWFDDVHGDADWRAHLTGRLAEQVRQELS